MLSYDWIMLNLNVIRLIRTYWRTSIWRKCGLNLQQEPAICVFGWSVGWKILGAAAPKPPLLQLVYFNLSTDAFTIDIPCNIQTRVNVESVSAKVQTSRARLASLSHLPVNSSYFRFIWTFEELLDTNLVPRPQTVFSQSQPSTDYRRRSNGRCIKVGLILV